MGLSQQGADSSTYSHRLVGRREERRKGEEKRRRRGGRGGGGEKMGGRGGGGEKMHYSLVLWDGYGVVRVIVVPRHLQ